MSNDPLEIQVNVKIIAPKGRRKLITKKLMQQAIERWAFTGQQSKWIEIRAVHWINPERRDTSLAVWKVALADDMTEAEYASLQIGGELRSPDSIENARRSLHLDSMSTGGFSAFIRVVQITAAKRERPSRGKKHAGKRQGKLSKVRNTKGKGRSEPPVSGRGSKVKGKKKSRKKKSG